MTSVNFIELDGERALEQHQRFTWAHLKCDASAVAVIEHSPCKDDWYEVCSLEGSNCALAQIKCSILPHVRVRFTQGSGTVRLYYEKK